MLERTCNYRCVLWRLHEGGLSFCLRRIDDVTGFWHAAPIARAEVRLNCSAGNVTCSAPVRPVPCVPFFPFIGRATWPQPLMAMRDDATTAGSEHLAPVPHCRPWSCSSTCRWSVPGDGGGEFSGRGLAGCSIVIVRTFGLRRRRAVRACVVRTAAGRRRG